MAWPTIVFASNSFGISFGTSKVKVNEQLQDGKQNNTVFGLSINSLYFAEDQFAIGLTGSFSSGSTVYKEDGDEDDKSSSVISCWVQSCVTILIQVPRQNS